MRRGFVVPAARAVSGGHRYNAAVLAHWPGVPPELVTLAGPWPDGDAPSRAALAAALARFDVAVVDGLVGAAHPDLLAAAATAGRRTVLLVHLPLGDEGGLPAADRRRLDDLERDAVHAAWRVVATSRTAAAEVARRHGRPDVATVTPGVEPAPLATPQGPPHLVAVGAIGPRKDQLTTLRALTTLLDLPWHATLAGPVADRDHALAVADLARTELRGRVTLPGELDAPALADLWSSAHLLVHPAHAETWGMVVTEALARGVPAVVGAGTGAVEALASGTPDGPAPGASVVPGDVAALAATLQAWLTDAKLRYEWEERARVARAGLKDWGQAAAEFAALLEET